MAEMDSVQAKLGIEKVGGIRYKLLCDQYWAGDLLTDTITQEEYDNGTYACKTANELLPIPDWREVLVKEYSNKGNLPYALWVYAIARERNIEINKPVIVPDDFMNKPIDVPDMVEVASGYCNNCGESYDSVVSTIKACGPLTDEDLYRAIPVYLRKIGKPVVIQDLSSYCGKLSEVYGDCELRWQR